VKDEGSGTSRSRSESGRSAGGNKFRLSFRPQDTHGLFTGFQQARQDPTHTFKWAEFETIDAPLHEFDRGIADALAFLRTREPDVVVYDVSPPYERTSAFCCDRQEADERRAWVITSTTPQQTAKDLRKAAGMLRARHPSAWSTVTRSRGIRLRGGRRQVSLDSRVLPAAWFWYPTSLVVL
jgi:hypothetical protein